MRKGWTAEFIKYFILFGIGGIAYVVIELLWRGYSHWSMFALGGLCFLLIGRLKADEAVVRTDFKNLSVIPSSMDLVGAELELVDEERRQYRLRDALRPLREQYDVIAVDCPPSLGLLTINALTAADGVVVPLLCEYYSLEGLSQLTQTIRQIKKLYNPSLELLGVLINMYDGRLNLTVQVMDEIKRHFADKLFRVPIPRNVKVSEAPSFGQPITEYDRSSRGAVAYTLVAEELIKRLGG